MTRYEELREKYTGMLDEELGTQDTSSSSQYIEFRKQYLPKRLTLYENACALSEKILAVAPDKKKIPALELDIQTVHLQVTPRGVASFALLAPLVLILLALIGFFFIPSMLGGEPMMFFIIFFLIVSLIMFGPLGKLPTTLAANWRQQAGNQMVLSIFYIVTYMRHTSNLERAIDFAAEHLGGPLSLDMKKILWDVETEKYESVRESLDNYLMRWKDSNMEYVESMHLIEGSLVESSESRRVEMLDKALSVMLDETYEKMLHYAHDLKSPITTLHMLGVILPILGLVILPLVVTMMSGVYWYHLFMLYNVALPIGVYLLGRGMLAKRPSGYGQVDIAKLNPELKKLKGLVIGKTTVSPLILAVLVFGVFVLIGLTPLLYGFFNPTTDIIYSVDARDRIQTIEFQDANQVADAKYFFYGWWERKNDVGGKLIPTGEYYGPFGFGAALMSLFIPLGIGLGLATYYRVRSKNIMKLRIATKKLEKEFASGLFQLGNRLADGIPVEIAFSKVASVMQGTETGRFFEAVSTNIAKLGMSVERAIFDEKQGAIREYPSSIIESSMKVLVESTKKGPLIASRAIINISEYIKQMHRVDERLKDLMADVISSMKSQVTFLTPIISGIVIGITSMIIKILGTLTNQISSFTTEGGADVGGGLVDIFGAGGIPTYFFQIIVGLYVVQLAYILTVLVNGIENGSDVMGEEEALGVNIWKSTLLYVIMSLVIMFIFNMVAGQILLTQ